MKHKILFLVTLLVGAVLAALYDYGKFISEMNSIKCAGAGAIGESRYSAGIKHALSVTKSQYAEAQASAANSSAGNSTQYQLYKKNKMKIVKNAKINIQVKDFAKSKSLIENFIKKHDAYIANEVESNTSANLESTVSIRVPIANFEPLIKDLLSVALYINSKTITAEDVTEKYVDLESRLKAKKEVEKRYYDILNKASKVEDILSVEEQLKYMLEEIESMEGKLRYLNDQVLFSTVELSYYQEIAEPVQPPRKTGFFQDLLNALKNGWRSFGSLFIGMISVWPFVILIILIFFAMRRYVKKRKTQV